MLGVQGGLQVDGLKRGNAIGPATHGVADAPDIRMPSYIDMHLYGVCSLVLMARHGDTVRIAAREVCGGGRCMHGCSEPQYESLIWIVRGRAYAQGSRYLRQQADMALGAGGVIWWCSGWQFSAIWLSVCATCGL